MAKEPLEKRPGPPPPDNSSSDSSSSSEPLARIPAKKASFHDSAYESLALSKNGSGASRISTMEETNIARKGRPFPGTGLTEYRKEHDKETIRRFNQVVTGIEKLLEGKKEIWNRGNPYPSAVAIRIHVLGENEIVAAPYLVVFCSPNWCRRVRNLLKSKHVRELYDKQGLKMIVLEHPPRKTSAVLDIDVCLNNEPTSNQITFCGSPILLVDKTDGPSRGRTRKATFGGIIEVTLADGSSTQYGMTAGHAIEDLLTMNREKTYKVYHLEDSDNLRREASAQAQHPTSLTRTDDWEWESSYDSWESAQHTSIASILDNNILHNVSESTTPLHDWALFEMTSTKPNMLCTLDFSEQSEGKPLMIAAKPSFGDNLWDPVIMIGPLGLKRGQLSNLPGSIMRGNSKSFVKTYMLEFDEGYEVCEGDSGAWVVHHAGLEVFGHVVATDILGDAYIMPAVETFDEIRDCMNAASVKLPSYGEDNNNTSVVTKIPLTATSLEPQNHFHGPSIMSAMQQNKIPSGTTFKLPPIDSGGFRTTFEPREIVIPDFETIIKPEDISYPLSKRPTPPLSVDFQEFRGYSEFHKIQVRPPNTPSESEDDLLMASAHIVPPNFGDHHWPKTHREASEDDKALDLKGVSKLLGKQNLFLFEKEIAKDAMKGFKKARQQLETLLIEHIQSTPQTAVLEPPFVIQIHTLGRNESEAVPHLVILCSPKRCKRIRRLVNSSRARKICEADRAFPPLEVQVVGCSPLMRLTYQEVGDSPKSTIARVTDQNTSHGGRKTSNHNYESLSLFQNQGYEGNRKFTLDNVGKHAFDGYSAPDFNGLDDANEYATSPRTQSRDDDLSAKPQKLENLPSLCTPPPSQQMNGNPIPSADSSNMVNTLGSACLTRKGWYKGWDSVFSDTHRNIWVDTHSFVDKQRAFGYCGEGIEIFLQDYEDSGLDDKVEELKAFSSSASLERLKAGSDMARPLYNAWLDERSVEGVARTWEHRNPLTATQLYELLTTSQHENSAKPTPDRRLIYIRNLDASYMLALAETAASHEVPLLRDAIWKHYARQISLKVSIPLFLGEYKIFQLEFHLPYFVFRSSHQSRIASHTDSNIEYPHGWTDLSFLEPSEPKLDTERKFGMFEGHFSFAICGLCENRWVAYAFDDTEPHHEDLSERLFCGGAHWDPIAFGILTDDLDAELPIWNPREYFLNIVARRLCQAADSWEGLLRAITRRVMNYRKTHPSTISNRNGRDSRGRQEETIKSFDWTRQTIELVNRLEVAISQTTKLWENFNAENGDIDYFSYFDSSEANTLRKALLCEISEHFNRLQIVKQSLEVLSASCKDSAKVLELRLTLESAETHYASGDSTTFQIFILLPIAVAAACLQYSPNLMPLPAAPALIILTAIFIVTIKLLHALFHRLPSLSWRRGLLKAYTTSEMLHNVGKHVLVAFVIKAKRRYDRSRREEDIELGLPPPLPI